VCRISGSAIASLLGVGLGIGSSAKVDKLEAKMNQIIETMKNHENSLRVFKQGMLTLNRNQEILTEYIADSPGEVYKVIEDVRCAQYADMHELAKQQGLHIFRNYVQNHIEAVIEAAHTGRITPRILGVGRLKKILAEDPATSNRVVSFEPSIVYQFGKVFPVKFDWNTLTFGYVLEVPNPRVEDIMPVYKIFNVGFHRVPDISTFRAPLPLHVIMDNKHGLVALDDNLCTAVPGLRHCELGAASKVGPGSGCLKYFLGRNCQENSDCEDAIRCSEEVYIDHRQRNRTAVITTVAGILIRTQNERVVSYSHIQMSGSRGSVQPLNQFGTYWLPHSKFVSVTVGDLQYASIGEIVRFVVVIPAPFNLSTVPPAEDQESVDMRRRTYKQVKKRLKDLYIRPVLLRRYVESMTLGNTIILLTALFISLILIVYCCRRKRSYKNLCYRQRSRYRTSPPPPTDNEEEDFPFRPSNRRPGREYLAWNPRDFLKWINSVIGASRAQRTIRSSRERSCTPETETFLSDNEAKEIYCSIDHTREEAEEVYEPPPRKVIPRTTSKKSWKERFMKNLTKSRNDPENCVTEVSLNRRPSKSSSFVYRTRPISETPPELPFRTCYPVSAPSYSTLNSEASSDMARAGFTVYDLPVSSRTRSKGFTPPDSASLSPIRTSKNARKPKVIRIMDEYENAVELPDDKPDDTTSLSSPKLKRMRKSPKESAEPKNIPAEKSDPVERNEFVEIDLVSNSPCTPVNRLEVDSPATCSQTDPQSVMVIMQMEPQEICAIHRARPKRMNKLKRKRSGLGFVSGFILHQVPILVDTGADISVVDRGLVEKAGALQHVKPLKPNEGVIRQYDENVPCRMIGRLKGAVYLAGGTHEFAFYVPEKPWTHRRYRVIVGNDLLKQIGEVRINLARERLTLIDTVNKAKLVFRLKNNKVILTPEGQEMKRIGNPVEIPPDYVSGNTTVTPVHKPLNAHSWASHEREPDDSLVLPSQPVPPALSELESLSTQARKLIQDLEKERNKRKVDPKPRLPKDIATTVASVIAAQDALQQRETERRQRALPKKGPLSLKAFVAKDNENKALRKELAEQKVKAREAREKRIQKKARQEAIAAQKEKEKQKKEKLKKARELANQKKPVLQKKHITRQVTQAAKESAPPDPVVVPAPEPDSDLSPQILALGKDSENEADDASSEYSVLSSDSEDDFSIISSISDSETQSDCDPDFEGNTIELMMLEQDTPDNPPDEVRSFTSQTPAQGSSQSDDPYNLSSPDDYVLTETDDKIVDWLSENVDSQTSLESAIESANRAVE
jgi:hypothetical protein